MTCSRIVTGTADLLIAADEVVAIAKETIALCESRPHLSASSTPISSRSPISSATAISISSAAASTTCWKRRCSKESTFLDFTKAAEALLGDSIATNMMMMGFAYQQGLLPLQAASIEQAIELNGVSIKMNTLAFQLGRLAAADPARLADDAQGRR